MAGKSRLFALAVALSCAVLPRAGVAAPAADARERARARLAEGAKLLEGRRFAEALSKFEEAYALVPSPKILYNFGRAYVGLAREPEAFDAFDRFLDEAKDAGAEHTAHARAEVNRLVARIARIEVACDVEGAEVTVDGRAAGTTPLRRAIPVMPGAHQVSVASPRHGVRTRVFTAAGGEVIRLPIELRAPELATPPILPAQDFPRTEPAAPPEVTAAAAPADGSAPKLAWTRTARWVAVGAAAAALAAGAYFNVVANDRRDAFAEKRCVSTSSTQCDGLRDDYDGARRYALVGYVAAGILGASAVTLFLVAPPSQSQQAGGTALGVSYAARF